MLGIIGGTGLTQLASLEITHRQVIRTPYGEPSGPLTYGNINNHQVVFLARRCSLRLLQSPPACIVRAFLGNRDQ